MDRINKKINIIVFSIISTIAMISHCQDHEKTLNQKGLSGKNKRFDFKNPKSAILFGAAASAVWLAIHSRKLHFRLYKTIVGQSTFRNSIENIIEFSIIYGTTRTLFGMGVEHALIKNQTETRNNSD